MNVETRRMVMRAIEPSDAQFLADMINDPETRGLLGAYNLVFPMSVDMEERWIESVTKKDETHLMVTLKGSLKPIGLLSVKDINKRCRAAHISIILEKASWDKGYGTEAVKGIVAFMFDRMNMHRIWLRVAEQNKRAIACYKKCGFKVEGKLREDHFAGNEWRSSHLMSILENDFRGKRK